jgi:D-sedoheptulose 7-phosphate isomerase
VSKLTERARQALLDSARANERAAQELPDLIAAAAEIIIASLREGHLVAFCGNGGSAADAQHLAGELVGRFRLDRPAFRALALTTDTSVLTAIANDFGYERIFARQVEALLGPGDVLVAITTSGASPNVLEACRAAAARGARTIGMTGSDGGALKALADLCLCVPAHDTPRIQELHIIAGHVICELVEEALGEPR